MCNLYSLTKGQQAIIELTRAMHDRTGNLPPMPGIFPDYPAPIVRNVGATRELAMARWGMPSPAFALEGKKTDPGVTNVRNTASPHWRRWLKPENRCLVPFTSFSEFNRDAGGDIWFALNESRPLACFAGIWVEGWTSTRKVKEGPVSADFFAFLTTTPNAEVAPIHPKAMPVILTEPGDFEVWMNAPWDLAKDLQRPFPDGTLTIVAKGGKKDGTDA
jgi:putative SOS response-associated peptidase YedK